MNIWRSSLELLIKVTIGRNAVVKGEKKYMYLEQSELGFSRSG